MGKILWPLCPRGHIQNHSNVRFDCSRSYIHRRCKLCTSITNRAGHERRKAKQEWLKQNFKNTISARRTATDNGSINPKTVVRSVLDASPIQ